jgi:hypothetical protein
MSKHMVTPLQSDVCAAHATSSTRQACLTVEPQNPVVQRLLEQALEPGTLAAPMQPGTMAAPMQVLGATLGPVRTAFGDGSHCAFTDLARFGSRIYLAFRSSPVGHSPDPSGEIVCLSSGDDGQNWEPACRFSLSDSRDPRDPHFLVFNGKLFIYTGAWLCNPLPGQPASSSGGASVDSLGNLSNTGWSIDINEMIGFAVWTEDGASWSAPTQLEGTQSHYIWRVAAQQGRAFMSARRRRGFVVGSEEAPAADIECALLTSQDGLAWSVTSLFAEHHGDETAFLLERDGSILGLVRGAPDVDSPGSEGSQIVWSEWPYSSWSRHNTGVYVGGPLLFEWGGRYIVGGRHRGLVRPSHPHAPRPSSPPLARGSLNIAQICSYLAPYVCTCMPSSTGGGGCAVTAHLHVQGTRDSTPSTTFLWELQLDGDGAATGGAAVAAAAGGLRPLLELPSSGDCSYPGYVQLSEAVGLVSWYSGDAQGESVINVAEVAFALGPGGEEGDAVARL